MALHYVHKSVWSHCEICKESFCLLTHFQVESKVLFPVPIICLKRTNYWRPIACREKDGTGDSGQCWPPVWVTPHRLLGENGQGTPDPFSISTTPSTACLSHSPKCSLGVKNKYIFQKALGQNESELPRTVVIKVLESINRKFFFFFFFKTIWLPSLQPWGQKHHQWQGEVLLGSKILLRPSWGDICGERGSSETSCQCQAGSDMW